jgi:hypothetical protein
MNQIDRKTLVYGSTRFPGEAGCPLAKVNPTAGVAPAGTPAMRAPVRLTRLMPV